MADPKRWKDLGSDASDLERDLLRNAPKPAPAPGDREVVLAAVLARVAGGTPPPATGSSGLTATKIILAALALIGIAILVYPRKKDEPIKATPAPVAQVETVVAPPPSSSAPIVEPEPPPVAVASAAPKPAAKPSTSTSTSSSLASRLREEADLIAKAREAVRAGNYASALASIDTAKTKFPGGVLIQERKAIEIEAIYRSGDKARASKLAEAFLQAYPTSPHAARVREFQ